MRTEGTRAAAGSPHVAAVLCGCMFLQCAAAEGLRVIKVSDSVVDPRALYVQGGRWGNAVNGQSFQQEALVSFRDWQYATYYDSSRRLCLARRQASSAQWEVVRFRDHTFEGNDSHNVAVMGICPADGTIHLAFDHHGNALRYRRSVSGLATRPVEFKWNVEVFGPITSELESGKALRGVTYPRFLTTPGGALQFGCRIGGSGNGDKCLADYNPKTGGWHGFAAFIGRQGLYGSSSARNGYLNGLNYDTRGRLHVTWCWRETGDPMTNHDLNYAWSDDGGISWFNNLDLPIGKRGKAPILIDSPGLRVVGIETNRGLVNATTQAIDSRNRIHIVTMHMADASLARKTWADMRKAVDYFHYWRDDDGEWHRNRLILTGSRPQLRFDSNDNAFLVLTGDRYNPSSDLTIAAASARDKWKDWRVILTEPGPFVGQPRLDAGDRDRSRMAVYVQEEPRPVTRGAADSVTAGGAEGDRKEPGDRASPLRVIEYSFN